MQNDVVFHREVFGGLLDDGTSSVVRYLSAKWTDIRSSKLPCYGDFFPDSNPRVMENAMVLVAAESGDFVYLHMGSSTTKLVGRDLTGRTVASLEGGIVRYTEDIYRRVRDSFVPAHCLFSANSRDVVDLWERIVLPVQVAPGSGPTCLLLYSEPVNFRANMLEHALDAADNAILCTRPTIGPEGDIIDAWVTFANGAARNLFNLSETQPAQLARQLPFLFNDDSIWVKLTQPRPLSPHTIWHKNVNTQADYMISSRLSGDSLIFSVASMSTTSGDLAWNVT